MTYFDLCIWKFLQNKSLTELQLTLKIVCISRVANLSGLDSGVEVAELLKRWTGDVGVWFWDMDLTPGCGVPLPLILSKEKEKICIVLKTDEDTEVDAHHHH